MGRGERNDGQNEKNNIHVKDRSTDFGVSSSIEASLFNASKYLTGMKKCNPINVDIRSRSKKK